MCFICVRVQIWHSQKAAIGKGGLFVYNDVSSNSDLNQLMFIIRNSGLFVVNRDT